MVAGNIPRARLAFCRHGASDDDDAPKVNFPVNVGVFFFVSAEFIATGHCANIRAKDGGTLAGRLVKAIPPFRHTEGGDTIGVMEYAFLPPDVVGKANDEDGIVGLLDLKTIIDAEDEIARTSGAVGACFLATTFFPTQWVAREVASEAAMVMAFLPPN